MSQAANQKVMPFLPELQNAKDPDFVPRYYVALPLFSIGLLLNSLVLTTILRNRDRLLQTRLDALVALLLCTFVYWSASCVALLVILVLVYDGDPMRRILAGNVSFTGGAIMACNLLLAGERFAAFYKARLMSASASAREGVPDGVGAESALRSEQADSLDPALGWQNRGAYAMYPNPMRRAGDLQQRSLFNFAEPFLDPSPSFVGQMMSEGVVHDWIDCDDAAQRLSSAQKMTESMVPNVTVSPRDSQLNSSISRTVSWETWYLRVIVGYFLIYWIIVIYVFSTSPAKNHVAPDAEFQKRIWSCVVVGTLLGAIIVTGSIYSFTYVQSTRLLRSALDKNARPTIIVGIERRILINCMTMGAGLLFCYTPCIISITAGLFFSNWWLFTISQTFVCFDVIVTPCLVLYFSPATRRALLARARVGNEISNEKQEGSTVVNETEPEKEADFVVRGRENLNPTPERRFIVLEVKQGG